MIFPGALKKAKKKGGTPADTPPRRGRGVGEKAEYVEMEQGKLPLLKRPNSGAD